MKKNVWLILDSFKVSKQINDLIDLSHESDNYRISTLIINNVEINQGNIFFNSIKYIFRFGVHKFISAVFFKLICKFEQNVVMAFYTFPNFYKKYDLDKEKFKVINLNPNVSKNGLVYKYTKSEIELIRNLNLELLIRGGGAY